MEMLTGDNIRQLPFKNLEKVSDLLYYDGPILSHFRDKYGKDILFYWVDYNNEYNRWLVFQVTEKQLFDYLLQKGSLKSIIENPFNDIYYCVEIGEEIEYKNVYQIFKEDINQKYIPKKDVIFQSETPNIYKKKSNKYKDTYAQDLLLPTSLFMKAEPANRSNMGLVGILYGADFLDGIGNSFKGLVESEATKEFVLRGIADQTRISQATTRLVVAMQPNLVMTKAASFAIAISPNSFTAVGEDFLNKEWRDKLFAKFKNDVVEIDKKSLKDIDNIVKQYGENNTTDIYKPLVELYNNKHLVLSITDKNFTPTRTIQRVKKEAVQKLVKKRTKDQEDPVDRLAKVKYHPSTGKIAGMSNATLFDQSIYTAWKTDEIRTEKKNYKLKHTIHAEYIFENGIHSIEGKELDTYASGESLPEAETNFYEVFHNLYEELVPVENVKLTPRQIEIKSYILFHTRG
jgi:hypothetical protein